MELYSRLPTPEGLSPTLSPAALNDYMTDVINNYTLSGVTILVHCRGGVGRAGVVACCWILKLGLCGWLDDETPEVSPVAPSFLSSLDLHSSEGHSWSPLPPEFPTQARSDALHLVEKVIRLVRRRRSIKAIETYEQVKFLVDFVEFLRNHHGQDPLS